MNPSKIQRGRRCKSSFPPFHKPNRDSALGMPTSLDSSCSRDLCDPVLDHYSPSERRAILVHRYFLGIELRQQPSLADTVRSWETSFARPWRREKALRDVAAQLREIEQH